MSSLGHRIQPNQWLIVFFNIAFLIFAVPALASVNTSLTWLASHANGDGSYGQETDIATTYQATSEVLTTFQVLNQAAQLDSVATLAYLDGENAHNTEYLSRKIFAEPHSTNTLVYLNELTEIAWTEGGFGDLSGYSPTILDTAFALDALNAAGQNNSETALRALSYLVNNQNLNGSWSDTDNIGNVYLTALAAHALISYKNQYPDVARSLVAARNFLLSQQNLSGLWDSDFETAQALLALIPIVSDLSILSTGVQSLAALQQADGSWSGDVYTTALSARALALFDLAKSPTATGTSSIAGYVMSSATHQPIADASVSIASMPGISVSSNADGYFMISGVPEGRYTLWAQKTGYADIYAAATAITGQTTNTGQLTLTNDNSNSATLTIYGQIFDGISHAPVAGASIVRTDTNETISSSAVGEFILSQLTSLSVPLTISAPNYAPQTLTLTASAFGSMNQLFLLAPLANNTGANTSNFSGKITDAYSHAAIANATVSIEGSQLQTVSDANGQFQLNGASTLSFTMKVSAPGYQSQSRPIQLADYGNYSLNFDLSSSTAQAPTIFYIASLSKPAVAEANSTALVTAQVNNLSQDAQEALILAEVFNANGESVGQVLPYAPGTTTTQANYSFSSLESKVITLVFETKSLPSGSYRLVLRVVKPGSITQTLPTGVVLDATNTYVDIAQTQTIAGELGFTPPLSQAGSQQPVQLNVLVMNKGNVALQNEDLNLTIVNPKTQTTVHTATAKVAQLEVMGSTMLSFGSWLPSSTIQGDLPVTVRAANTAITGEIAQTYYVGDKATGVFTLDKSAVAEGTQTVHATVNLQGVDVTRTSSTDPLFFAVREAVKTGAIYTAQEAKNWQQKNHCTGCHIQSQSLVGVSLAFQKNLGDEFEANTLYNSLASAQPEDGGLRDSQSGYTKTQTALGIWALSSYQDINTSFRTLYKAADHMFIRNVQGINQTWWTPDYASGWWYSNESHTAMVVKGYAKLLQASKENNLTTFADYGLSDIITFPIYYNPRSVTQDNNGLLYIANYYGQVVQYDPQTKHLNTLLSQSPVTNAYSVAVDNNDIYVAGKPGKLIRRNADGSIDTLLSNQGNELTDVDLGKDGLLYVVDHSSNQILRLDRSGGQLEVLASGGLLHNPYSLEFLDDTHLIIANYDDFNILKLDLTTRKLSVFADSLAYQPRYITKDGQGGFYYTSEKRYDTPASLNHLTDKGVIERLMGNSKLSNGGVVATANGVFMTGFISNGLYKLNQTMVEPNRLTDFQEQLEQAVNYFLANYQDNTTDNIIQSVRLMGLAEAKPWVKDANKVANIDSAMQTIVTTLRNRQRSDGGWGKYVGWQSDVIVTALVGLSIDYTQPSADDQMVRRTIQYLLSQQRGNHSWHSNNVLWQTDLAATSLVTAYLPVALERLGGLDVDLNINFPANINLSNSSIVAAKQITQPNGVTAYHWHLLGVTANSRNIEFDLTFNDMLANETRTAADSAYLAFANSFSGEQLQSPLAIPTLKATNGLALTLNTDKPNYLANDTVNIALTASNVSDLPKTGHIQLEVRAASDGALVATLPSLPFSGIAAHTSINLNSQWLTGTILTGGYQLYARLFDSQNRLHDETTLAFQVNAPSTVITSAIHTDKVSYQAWDQVQLLGRIANVSQNAIQPPTLVEITVTNPQGQVIFNITRSQGELLPNSLRDLTFEMALKNAAAGSYQVDIRIKDAATQQQLSATRSTFTVGRQLVQALSGTVTATPVQVNAGEPVQCKETVSSLVTAQAINLTSQLLNMDSGQLINENNRTVSIQTGQSQMSVRTIATGGLAAGAYACLLSGEIDGVRRQLGMAGFEVRVPPIRIDGSLQSGEHGRVLVLLDKAASIDSCQEIKQLKLKNQSTLALTAAAQVQVNLQDGDGKLLDSETATFNTPTNAHQTQQAVDLGISTFDSQQLVVQLNAATVLPKNLKVTAQITDGSQSKVLTADISALCTVAVNEDDDEHDDDGHDSNSEHRDDNSKHDGKQDSHDDEHDAPPLNRDFKMVATLPTLGHDDSSVGNTTPALAQQRQTLETLLNSTGWSYTVVTSADSFMTQLHSGGYGSYALLSERVKLAETQQKELREAVFRGEGLLEAGSSDQRQGRIDEVLGIKFIGKHPSMNGVVWSNNAVHAAGHGVFNLHDKTLKASLVKAAALAYYDSSSGQDLAASTAVYGTGRADYFGFDVLAEAAMPNADPLFGELLLGALNHVQPSTLPATVGGAYPVRLTLVNQGNATPGQAVLTLPTGVKVVDALGATAADNTLVWSFDLALAQTQTFNSWLSLPSAPVTLSAQVQTGSAPNVKDHTTATLSITPQTVVSLAALNTQVQALNTKTYKQVQKYLSNAVAEQQQGDSEDAVKALLQASDELIKINTAESASVRSQLANVLRVLSQSL